MTKPSLLFPESTVLINYYLLIYSLCFTTFSKEFAFCTVELVEIIFEVESYCFHIGILPNEVHILGHIPTLADSGFFKNFLYPGGVKSTVFWVFEDLKFKISEGYN